MIYMIDTDISSYILRRYSEAVKRNYEKRRMGPDNKFYISAITCAELLIGVQNKPSWGRLVSEYLGNIDVLDWTRAAAAHYAEIVVHLRKNGRAVDVHDMQIAAHARSMGATIVTNNERHFQDVPGILIENWIEGSMI